MEFKDCASGGSHFWKMGPESVLQLSGPHTAQLPRESLYDGARKETGDDFLSSDSWGVMRHPSWSCEIGPALYSCKDAGGVTGVWSSSLHGFLRGVLWKCGEIELLIERGSCFCIFGSKSWWIFQEELERCRGFLAESADTPWPGPGYESENEWIDG